MSDYRNKDCVKCGRHRVEKDGTCEKCYWNEDDGFYDFPSFDDSYNPNLILTPNPQDNE